MKVVAALLLLAALACATPINNINSNNVGKRLISFSEDHSKAVWMTPEEIDIMSGKKEVGFMDITDYTPPKQLHYAMAIPSNPSFPANVSAMMSQIDADNWWDLVLSLEAMGTRHRTTNQGIATPGWILDRMRAFGAGTTLNVEYELFEHTSIPQDSTITRIVGCDPSVRDEVVIVGGHEDSTSTNINIAPGADDDATGTATVMEVFRVLVQSNFCPRRTLEFHTYAGEEGGLIGSNQMAANYNSNDVNVISMVQFDMTAFDDDEPIALIRDYTSPVLNTFLGQLLDAYVPELDYVTNSACGYACSDHGAWNSRGYPAAFPFEAAFGSHNSLIHTANDTNNRLSRAKGAAMLKLAVSYLVEMALF